MSEFRRRLMNCKQYTIVDYILTNGEAYIDTEYYPNPDTEIEMLYRMSPNENTSIDTTGTNIGNGFFSAVERFGNIDYAFSINHGVGSNQYLGMYLWSDLAYSSGGTIVEIAIKIEEDSLLSYKYIDNRYFAFLNKTQKLLLSPTHTFVKTSLCIAMYNNTLPYSRTDMRIYNFKILERGKIIKNFVPALKDGVYGLADVVSCKFYASPNGKSFNY